MSACTEAGRLSLRHIRPVLLLLAAFVLFAAPRAAAQDPENCLSCHRFRGLSRLDPETNELRLFFCSAEYYAHREGAHARLRCTACHARDEVAVIPHQVKTRVDCTQACHITPAATGAELRFSHQRVEDSLAHSVHSPEKLATLSFDPPLLHAGQSYCLYCHDQPTFGFGRGLPEGFLDHSGGTRCDTCHSEELPLEIGYFAKHVAGRMKPARPVRQLVQVCAVCHSDEQLLERTGGHDPVASYLHSFHGKASLLGSQATATCVDCHSAQGGDQHLMLGRDDPLSSVAPQRVPNTCRTVACHPGFPPAVGTAAVHLQLDPSNRSPEFLVAAFFIILTAATMAVFFLLVILELLNAMVRRADPHLQRLVAIARQLQGHPEARKLLQRTSFHQRIQHWWLAISFITLVVTGMPIKFADQPWAEIVVGMLGGLTVVRMLHRVAGVVIIAVFFYHLFYLLGKLVQTRRRLRREGVREPLWKTIWNSPMVVRPKDVRQFFQLFAHLFFLRKHRPHADKYNVLEKFEYWAVFWGMPVMGLTGAALWGAQWTSEQLGGRALNFAFIIHSDEAYLAFTYIAAIHLFAVIFAPTVFPLSPGTLTGQAPVTELVEKHHTRLEDLARRVGLDPDEIPVTKHPWLVAFGRSVVRRIYSGIVAGLYISIAAVSLGFLASLLTGHQTAPVEIVGIPARLDADEFFEAAAAPSALVADERQVRGPLAHFHLVPQWFQADPLDNCTTSGCHTPLPHGNRIEVRAFLNMHATFVDCVVCHTEQPTTADQAGWFALPQRERSEVPAILRLAALLEILPREVTAVQAAEVSGQLQALLREALPASGQHEQLQHWLLRLETTHPDSRIWQDILRDIRAEIDLHVRGEYGAKIGLYRDGRRIGEPDPAQRAAANAYRRNGANLPQSEREKLLDTVHAGIRPVGAMCTPCHAATPALVSMPQLGYPPARVESLQNNPILRSVLQIEQGQPFYLPLEERSQP